MNGSALLRLAVSAVAVCSAQTDRCASPPRFISRREHIGGSPVHAPRAVSSSNILTPTKTKKDALTDIFPVLAGVVRLELTARGFGDRCSTN